MIRKVNAVTRTATVFLSVLILITILPIGFAQATDEPTWYATGNNEGEFKICTVAELYELAVIVNTGVDDFAGKIINLTADIDLASEEWSPIGITGKRFAGTFDGQGHIIQNLTISDTSANYKGLFGQATQGTIKNLGVINANVSGKQNVGAIVGTVSVIENCFATGTVTGTANVGGVAGVVSSNITNSYSVVDSPFSDVVGSLIGQASNLYSTGKRPINSIGSNTVTIDNVVALSELTDGYGRITQYIPSQYPKATFKNNYAWTNANSPTSYTHDSNNGTDITAELIYSSKIWGKDYTNFDAENTWIIEEGKLPILRVFELYNAERGGSVQPSAIPAYILADLGITPEEPETPEIPDVPDTANAALAGDASLIEGDDGEYTVSVTNAPNANVISLLVQVDGDYLTTKEITGLNGFSVLGDVKWDADAEAWRIVLTNYGNSAIGVDEVEVCKIVLSTTDKIGVTIVKLTTATLTGATFEDGDFPINTIITSGEVEVNIAKYYSPYDTNRDGEIKQGDLSLAVLYYRATSASEYWSIAQYSDVNNDGIVNVEDFILIMANIVW